MADPALPGPRIAQSETPRNRERRLAKREQVAAACSECRLRKAKCDAARPACSRCRSRGVTCYYGVEPGTTRAVAHKRRHFELQERHDGLVELFTYLRTRSDPEVAEILRRIRETEDPLAVVRLVREGDILLQRCLSDPPADSVLRSFDDNALQTSTFKVPSRPWTVIAGDGIVSHLISQFFNREHRFSMPFICQDLFLQDMAEGNPANAYFCSPLLVNAICAFGAFGSDLIEQIDNVSKSKLRERFYDEAKKLFDREAGRATLTTTQALMILYMYSTSAAIDRAGLVFRFAACEMFKRLELGSKIPLRPAKYSERQYHSAIVQNARGLFLTESLVAFAYLQASLIAVPSIQRYDASHSTDSFNGHARFLSSDDVLKSVASGCAIFYSITTCRPSALQGIGHYADVENRRQLYSLISEWYESLPSKAYYQEVDFRQWHYLRCFYHFGAIAVFRPLQDQDIKVHSMTSTPAQMCVLHCNALIRELAACGPVSPFDFTHGSIETLFFHYICSFTLVMILDQDPERDQTLIACCRYLHQVSRYWPAAVALLVGIRALAEQRKTPIPQEAMAYFPEPSALALNNDVPISWAVPCHSDLVELLSDDRASTESMSIELGRIISKWAALSL